jgi:hypothetical protein
MKGGEAMHIAGPYAIPMARNNSRARASRRGPWVAMYLCFALILVPVVFYTALHLVFFGFTGEPVIVDLALGFVLPFLWIVGLLGTVRLRASAAQALTCGFATLVVISVLLILDTVRFQPIFSY